MAIKFNKGKIRLWKSSAKSGVIGLGINFDGIRDRKEMNQIHKAVEVILTLKYGKGVR